MEKRNNSLHTELTRRWGWRCTRRHGILHRWKRRDGAARMHKSHRFEETERKRRKKVVIVFKRNFSLNKRLRIKMDRSMHRYSRLKEGSKKKTTKKKKWYPSWEEFLNNRPRVKRDRLHAQARQLQREEQKGDERRWYYPARDELLSEWNVVC